MSAPVLQSKLPKVGTTVFSVMSALAVKHEAINLGQGFPDFDCDPRLVEAVADAMRSGHNQYPLMPGVPLLRERVAAKVEAMHGVRYDPASEITITAGATQGILSCILAVARPGDEVIVLEPCYDSYSPNIELAGAPAVPIPLRRGTFDPDFDAIAAAVGPATRAIVVNSPRSPFPDGRGVRRTGSASRTSLATAISGSSAMRSMSTWYSTACPMSAARHPMLRERTFVVSSFGKTFHVTGWKIGTVCAPAPLTAEILQGPPVHRVHGQQPHAAWHCGLPLGPETLCRIASLLSGQA